VQRALLERICEDQKEQQIVDNALGGCKPDVKEERQKKIREALETLEVEPDRTKGPEQEEERGKDSAGKRAQATVPEKKLSTLVMEEIQKGVEERARMRYL
jgi:hypothetical protein